MKSLAILALIFGFAIVTDCVESRAQELPKVNNLSAYLMMQKFGSNHILDDLEVVLSQRARIKTIYDEFKEEFTAILKSKPGPVSKISRLEAFSTKCFNEAFYDVLLPHQQRRFVQLLHRDEIRRLRGGLSQYVKQPKISSLVGISDQQAKAIEDVQTKNSEKMKAAADKFRKRAAEILAEEKKGTAKLLGNEQAKKLFDLIGERNAIVKPGSEAVFYLDQILRQK